MIIIHTIQWYGDGDCYVEVTGLSTDSKPTNVTESSLFFEVDTGDKFYFDGTTWEKVGA